MRLFIILLVLMTSAAADTTLSPQSIMVQRELNQSVLDSCVEQLNYYRHKSGGVDGLANKFYDFKKKKLNDRCEYYRLNQFNPDWR